MNGQFTYSSGSTTGYAATFDELVAATDLDITQAGDISFKKLASAKQVTITTSYSTKITSLDMGAMTSVTGIASGADGTESANTLTLSSATNVDLGSLGRYGAALSITTKNGATLDIASLDDVTAAGLQSDLTLTISGPASVTLSKIDDGTITLSNVAAATVSGFYGTLDVDAGVETLTTTDSVTIALDGATDLVTATLDFKYDWDPALTTAQAAVADDLSNDGYLEDYDTSVSIGGTDLKTLTVSGELLDLYLDEGNLETLTLTGVTMHGLTISGMDDLTTLSVASGNKIGDITLENSDNLSVANFDHTTNLDGKVTGTTAGTSTSVEKGVNFIATDNLGLTKLHTTGDHVDTFTVTGNDALAELDMTGLKDFGTTVEPSFALYDNDLTATKGSDTYDGETATSTTGADGGTADAGSWDDGTSGMDTMKIYLTAMAAEADADGYAGFDTVSTFDNTDASATATVSTSLSVTGPTSYTAGTTLSNDSTVLEMIEAVADSSVDNSVSATKGKKAFAITADGTVGFTINGTSVPATVYSMTGNGAVDALNLASTANKDLASAAGLTMDALHVYDSSITVSLTNYDNTASTTAGERYTNASLASASTATGAIFTVGIEDEFTLTVGGNSVTATPGGVSGNATTMAGLEAMFIDAWGRKYGDTGTSSTSAIATILDDHGDVAGKFIIQALQKDSGGNGIAVSLAVTDKTQASGDVTATSGNIGYMIGATAATSDNSTVATTAGGGGVLVTFESKLEGVTDTVLTGITSDVTTLNTASMTELTTNYAASTGVTTYALAQDPRTDVVNVVAAVANTATSTAVAATLFNRVTWLG
jgi:hypothetical protein